MTVDPGLVLVLLIVFAGGLIQGMLGFGMALVAMPMMTAVLGIQVASPAFALVSITGNLLNTWRWHSEVVWHDVLMLLIPASIGIPLGVLFLGRADPALVTRTLGVIIIIYAGLSLLGRSLPVEGKPVWAYGVGFFAGVIGGAFNTGGPPVVAYATARGWPPLQFKGTLAVFFFATGLIVVAAHAATGHLTAATWRIAALSAPALLLGLQLGVTLGRRVSPARFDQIVLVLLLALGIQLLF